MPTGIYIRTEEHKKSMSLVRLGKKNSLVHNKHISNAKRGKPNGKLGIKHTEKHKRKISLALRNKPKSESAKINMSLAHFGQCGYWKGKHRSKETKEKIALSLNKRNLSEKTKQKLREIRLGKVTPNFNSIACQQIDEYGKKHRYNFQHALNGDEVRVIGYSLDGYDAKKNVVIEYYEIAHRKRWRKDLVRQRRIMKHLGCKFIVLKEWEIK